MPSTAGFVLLEKYRYGFIRAQRYIKISYYPKLKVLISMNSRLFIKLSF